MSQLSSAGTLEKRLSSKALCKFYRVNLNAPMGVCVLIPFSCADSLQPSCLENPMDGGAWWAAIHGVEKSWTWLSDFTFTFHFHALEKEMATHSSILAWSIPGTEEPVGLPPMGSHRVRHDWSDLAVAAAEANYNIVVVLPYMNRPWVYMCSPSWSPFQPPSPSHPAGSSQCPSPEHPVSCIEPELPICFTCDNIHAWNEILLNICYVLGLF